MNNMQFKLDSSTKDFDEIFFNRPVSKIQASWVGLVTSKNVSIKEVSSIYQIINEMSHNTTLVADERQFHDAFAVDVSLKPKKTPGYSNIDDGIESLRNCKIIIFLAGKELNSDMELFMIKLLDNFKGLIVTDYPEIFNDVDFVGQKIIIADKNKIKSNYNFGLNHAAGLVQSYAQENKSPVVFFDKNQIICLDSNHKDTACIVNSKETIPKEDFIGFLVSLMSDKKIPLEADWLRYCQAAGYLTRKMQTEGLKSVKKYLEDKF